VPEDSFLTFLIALEAALGGTSSRIGYGRKRRLGWGFKVDGL
jgi:hypothetical protein